MRYLKIKFRIELLIVLFFDTGYNVTQCVYESLWLLLNRTSILWPT